MKEEYHDGIDLQPPRQHTENKDPLPYCMYVSIVLRRADQSQTGPDIPQGSSYRRNARDNIQPKEAHGHRSEDKDAHIQDDHA